MTFSLLQPAMSAGREQVVQELGEDAFDAADEEGRLLGATEAVEYARRARGERKRPRARAPGAMPSRGDAVRWLDDHV